MSELDKAFLNPKLGSASRRCSLPRRPTFTACTPMARCQGRHRLRRVPRAPVAHLPRAPRPRAPLPLSRPLAVFPVFPLCDSSRRGTKVSGLCTGIDLASYGNLLSEVRFFKHIRGSGSVSATCSATRLQPPAHKRSPPLYMSSKHFSRQVSTHPNAKPTPSPQPPNP